MSKTNTKNNHTSAFSLVLTLMFGFSVGFGGAYMTLPQAKEFINASVLGVRTSDSANLSGTGYVEPAYSVCPLGTEEVGKFAGMLRRDVEPKTATYNYTLPKESKISVVGFVKEGHPENGCPEDSSCAQGQLQEEFNLAVNGTVIGAYTDKGNVDNWFPVSGWATSTNIASGSLTIKTTHSHINDGRGAESVDYKLTVCAEPVSEPEPEPEPEPQPEPEPEPTAPGKGSIAVCLVILDPEGNIVDGSKKPNQSFSIHNRSESPTFEKAAGPIASTNFTTPTNLNQKTFTTGSSNDSNCQVQNNLELGNYYYSELVMPASGWKNRGYNDQYTSTIYKIDDFYSYTDQFFDNDSSNDDERNDNTDGHIVITESRPNRTLVVVVQYEDGGANLSDRGIIGVTVDPIKTENEPIPQPQTAQNPGTPYAQTPNTPLVVSGGERDTVQLSAAVVGFVMLIAGCWLVLKQSVSKSKS